MRRGAKPADARQPQTTSASLPMYDWIELRSAANAFWAGLRRHLGNEGLVLPTAPDRRSDYAGVWLEPGLLLSQTCGYPYVTRLRGRVRLVATPCYAAPGCRGARYSSFLMVARTSRVRRLEQLRGAIAIANSDDSQSGYSALRAVIAPHARGGRFFGRVLFSGGHRASLAAVAEGRADVCAADAVCVALARRHMPELMRGLRVLARSPAAPGLPFITAGDASSGQIEALRRGLAAALADPSLAEARAGLLLTGIELLDDRAYDRIGRIAARAAELGYPRLA